MTDLAPTSRERRRLTLARFARGLSIFTACVVTLSLIPHGAGFIADGDYEDLALLVCEAALFYVVCALTLRFSRRAIRRLTGHAG